MYVLGGLLLFIRLRSADLPADEVISLLPREAVVELGLRSFVVPVAAYATAAASLALFAWWRYRERGARSRAVMALVWSLVMVPFLLCSALIAAFLDEPGRVRDYWLAFVVAFILATALGPALAPLVRLADAGRLRDVVSVVGLLVVTSGAVMTVAFAWPRAPAFAPAKGVMRDGRTVAAFYLGKTADSLVLASGLCETRKTADLGQAIVLARGDVVSLTLEKPVHVDDRAAKRRAWGSLGVCGAAE